MRGMRDIKSMWLKTNSYIFETPLRNFVVRDNMGNKIPVEVVIVRWEIDTSVNGEGIKRILPIIQEVIIDYKVYDIYDSKVDIIKTSSGSSSYFLLTYADIVILREGLVSGDFEFEI